MTEDKNSGAFFAAIYRMVALIPAGKVVTYGQLALLAGRPRAARIVGYAMARAPEGLPCHRVVNRLGELSPGDIFGGAGIQRSMLEAEGVAFLPSGRIDLAAHIWKAEPHRQSSHRRRDDCEQTV